MRQGSKRFHPPRPRSDILKRRSSGSSQGNGGSHDVVPRTGELTMGQIGVPFLQSPITNTHETQEYIRDALRKRKGIAATHPASKLHLTPVSGKVLIELNKKSGEFRRSKPDDLLEVLGKFATGVNIDFSSWRVLGHNNDKLAALVRPNDEIAQVLNNAERYFANFAPLKEIRRVMGRKVLHVTVATVHQNFNLGGISRLEATSQLGPPQLFDINRGSHNRVLVSEYSPESGTG